MQNFVHGPRVHETRSEVEDCKLTWNSATPPPQKPYVNCVKH